MRANPREPRASDPRFVPSLRLLLEVEKYSLVDVGMMFGVTRERVRQWSNQYGINREFRWACGLNAVRIWDDADNRFKPVQKGVHDKTLRASRAASRRAQAEKRRALFRARVVATAENLRREGAALGWSGLLDRLGIRTLSHLIVKWNAKRSVSSATGLAEIKQAVGWAIIPKGANSHRLPRFGRGLTCEKHNIPFRFAASGSGGRWCNECQRERYAARKAAS